MPSLESSSSGLRVGYVLKRYPRFSETFVVNEILAHERAGVQVDIFALGPVTETHFQGCIADVKAPVRRLPDKLRSTQALWQLMQRGSARLPGFWVALEHTEGLDGDGVAQAIQLALAIRELGVVHLHAHFATTATAVARLAARLAGIGYSFTAHAKDIFCTYDSPQHVDLKLRDAAAAITVTDYNVQHLRTGFGSAADKVQRIYNGLELPDFPYTEPPSDARRIVAVGRLVEKKGFGVLVEACRLLHARGVPYTCQVVGDGPLREELQCQVERNGLKEQVHLLGPLPRHAVVATVRGAAAMAVPCIVGEDGNRDGLPTVLVEAMALGTPCVSTAVTGIPELVRHEQTGLCVTQDDPDALADALQCLLQDQALRCRLARSARELVERDFDVDRNTADLRRIFESCVASTRAAWQEAA